MKRSLNLSSVLGLGVAAAALSTGGVAHAEGDVGIELGNDGRLYTQLWDEDGTPQGRARVFSAEFIDLAGEVYADEPGFQLADGSLPAGQEIYLTMRGPIRVWNGSDANAFSATSYVEFTFGPNTITSPLGPGLSDALIFPVESGGGLHDHPDMFFRNPFAGVIIAEFSLATAGYTVSDPFWIVWGYNADPASVEAAHAWVEGNLVPTPGAVTLLALAGVAAGRRRR